MSAINKYTYLVDDQKLDFRDKLSLSELMKIILTSAGQSADENGFGMKQLMKMNCSWVLSRFFVEIQRMPLGAESFIVETWIEEVGAAVSLRNFKLYDLSGKLLGIASSLWAVINLETRRSIPLSAINCSSHSAVEEKSTLRKPRKILPFDEGALSNSIEIKYSHLDINEHVNTLNYVRWVSDCFPPDFYRNKRIKEFEINFLAEMRYGDFAEVFKKELLPNEEFCFDIKNRLQNSVCRSRLLFEETE